MGGSCAHCRVKLAHMSGKLAHIPPSKKIQQMSNLQRKVKGRVQVTSAKKEGGGLTKFYEKVSLLYCSCGWMGIEYYINAILRFHLSSI